MSPYINYIVIQLLSMNLLAHLLHKTVTDKQSKLQDREPVSRGDATVSQTASKICILAKNMILGASDYLHECMSLWKLTFTLYDNHVVLMRYF